MEISEIRSAAPAEGRAAVELETFALLDRLHIPYAWVAHETADTIADCDVVSEVLGISICKNLFLCNRQKTEFYLLTMPGNKPFQTKVLSAQLGTTRLSFAPPEEMASMLRCTPGSASGCRRRISCCWPWWAAAWAPCWACWSSATRRSIGCSGWACR